MIENKHRNIYKVVNNNSKKEILTTYNIYSEEYKICCFLEEDNYLKSIEKNDEKYFTITDKKFPRKKREKAYKKLIDEKGFEIPINRSDKPKLGGKGRTWEKFSLIINNNKTEIFLDTSWGNYIYFSTKDDIWYKIGIFIFTKNENVEDTISIIRKNLNMKYTIS